MRLAEARIKEAILHPLKMVRQEAVLYFSKCYSLDPEVMPLAIQAIHQYGRRDAFPLLHVLADLAQTEATLDWAIRELSRPQDRAFSLRLSRLVCNADPRLLQPRDQDIRKAPGFAPEFVSELQDRLRLLTWDADQCWRELEAIADKGKDKLYAGEIGFGHARQVIQALGRQAERFTDRLLTSLSQKIEDREDNPMTWMEIFLVMLAGEMRLEPAIPLIVAKLHDFGELLAEECVTALAKIGTDQAALALGEGFLAEGWDYRLYASGAFDALHADATVAKCLELLPQETEADIRTNLANGVSANFASEGIKPVRQLILRQEYDPGMLDLPSTLATVATIMGVTFPEYDQWKKEAEERQERQDQRMRELEELAQVRKPARPPPVRERKPQPVLRVEKKVGRNDPCPCGSGKKFKNCCMKSGGSKGFRI